MQLGLIQEFLLFSFVVCPWNLFDRTFDVLGFVCANAYFAKGPFAESFS
jgi:hypothetical protein